MKPYFETQLGKLYCGDALEVLKKLPKESVDVVITSPPYWSKRYYSGAEKIWGGDPNCEHEWEFNTRLNSQGGTNTEKAQVGKDKLCLGRFEVREAFCKKCGAWYGQLGLEPSPQMFVEHLVEIFREVKRVLKPTGSLFVNIDDTWCGGGHGGLVKDSVKDPKYGAGRNFCPVVDWSNVKVPQRSLCLVPELFAIKMVYEEGWVLREKLIWSKKVHIYKDRTTIGNAMPESVKSRFAHTWEYIFHFTKKPSKYYFNLDAVRVPLKAETIARAQRGVESWKLDGTAKGMTIESKKKWQEEVIRAAESGEDTLLGANPGDVVQINVRPFKDAHFAVYPLELPELLIKAACPPLVCSKCGKPYEPIREEVEIDNIDWKFYGADENGEYRGEAIKEYDKAGAENASEVKRRILQSIKRRKVTRGYKPSCNCNAKGVPGVVLDPFAGAGTTLVVAEKLGMRWIGIEISQDYCEIIKRRFENEVGDLVKNHRLERWLE